MTKSGRLETGDNISDIIGLSSTTVTYLAIKENRNRQKKCKIGVITQLWSSKVIGVDINRKHMGLPISD